MPPVRRHRTRKHRATPGQRSSGEFTNKPLPLVERTNKLSLEEFMSLYIPAEELKFRKGKKKKEDTTVQGAEKNTASSSESQAQTQRTEGHGNGTGDGYDQPQNTQRIPDKHNLAHDDDDDGHDEYTLDIYTAATIPRRALRECFNLVEQTSANAYKHSSIGWSAADKKNEMKLPDMKYMILRRAAGSELNAAHAEAEGKGQDDEETAGKDFLGFLSFMVTYEDGKEVLYCYEIHLVPEAQGQGLGEELMSVFERIGRRIGLEKAMLTVFKVNGRAVRFYERVGFTVDESSPEPRRLRNGTVKEADYQIMSKMLR